MINGDVNEFVDGLYYGDERIFLYNGKKYFIQGYGVDGKPTLFLETGSRQAMITFGNTAGMGIVIR